ncbi:MAG: hypothetical protein QF797_09400 [Alphaproteobacteria bacterium]|nr:hypothetical protein [Alphaproteobacteria bacterium]MDP6621877.1 hypothetical protein [Alphaproteobacteria bacterium]
MKYAGPPMFIERRTVRGKTHHAIVDARGRSRLALGRWPTPELAIRHWSRMIKYWHCSWLVRSEEEDAAAQSACRRLEARMAEAQRRVARLEAVLPLLSN